LDDAITIAFDNKEILSGICGVNDGNLRTIESSIGGFITARGNEIHFESKDEAGVKRFRTMMDNLITAVQEGEQPSPDYIRALAEEKEEHFFKDSLIQIPHGFNRVYPRTRNQAVYIQDMRENEICFCIGPAGTGKTFLAIAHALQFLLSKKMRKLVLTRPVRSRRKPGVPSRRSCAKNRPLFKTALRRHGITCTLQCN